MSLQWRPNISEPQISHLSPEGSNASEACVWSRCSSPIQPSIRALRDPDTRRFFAGELFPQGLASVGAAPLDASVGRLCSRGLLDLSAPAMRSEPRSLRDE